ncbi:hypothetical protein [Paenibacillus sp. YN15]|uniref:hypothetical protein n=1 Tax=Paenibacillus sp. YN15 TaxID=1742774 RepID=UPI0011BFD735|nr:hypothetical protein [Paenibacillus sp. YN15]
MMMDKEGVTQEELRMLLSDVPEKAVSSSSAATAAAFAPFSSRVTRSRARSKKKWWNLFR